MKLSSTLRFGVLVVAVVSTIAAATCYRETLDGPACTLAGYTPPTNACNGPNILQNDDVYRTWSGSGVVGTGRDATTPDQPVCHVRWWTRGHGLIAPCNVVVNFIQSPNGASRITGLNCVTRIPAPQ